MVEPSPKTQLPSSAAAAEETKDELCFMYGTKQEVIEDVKGRLENVEMNPLEVGLLERYLQDPAANKDNIITLLHKLEQKNSERKYAVKRIRKLVPLFEEHEFWSTQPVPRYTDALPSSAFNAAVEVKTVADVSQEPYGLPGGYEWCSMNLKDPAQLDELYHLLSNHYVEDTDGKFRFDYSI